MSAAHRPLVVDVGGGCVVWVQNARGWLLRPDGAWVVVESDVVPGLGGSVLTQSEVNQLVQQKGRPFP